jgi:hypothetical protein
MALTSGPNVGLLVNGLAGEAHYAELMRQWRGMDFWLQPRVINMTTTAPPGSPTNGDAYIVPTGASGAWSGQTAKIAIWSTVLTAWEFLTPKSGHGNVFNIADSGRYFYNGTVWQNLTPPVACSQARLSVSGANILMVPSKGNKININGSLYTIPSGGITLAATGAAANTNYFIYALQTAGVVSMERDVTVPAVDTTTGMPIKSGDSTRTLVGYARTTAASAWVDSVTQRFLLNFWDPQPLYLEKPLLTLSGAFGLNAYAIVPGGVTKLEFLTWGTHSIEWEWMGFGSTNVANNTYIMAALDGGNTDACDSVSAGTVGLTYSMQAQGRATPALGYHFVELYIQENTTSTFSFVGSATPGMRSKMSAVIQG